MGCASSFLFSSDSRLVRTRTQNQLFFISLTIRPRVPVAIAGGEFVVLGREELSQTYRRVIAEFVVNGYERADPYRQGLTQAG